MNSHCTDNINVVALSLDIGASLSKGCYTIRKRKESSNKNDELENNISDAKTTTEILFMQMDSEVISIPKSLIERDSPIDLGCIEPEKSAWIKFSNRDRSVIALGLLAKKFQAMRENQVHSVKYENAIGKCLAFIGAIFEKHTLDHSNTIVKVNLLIPYDERNSSNIIEKTLKKKAKNFYFKTQNIKTKIVDFKCFPEGVGGLLSRIDILGEKWFSSSKVAILMLGHRNCTVLVYERGQMISGETIRTGFFDYLKDIQNSTIGQNLDELEFVIPQISKKVTDSKALISSLVKANNEENRKEELEKIVSAIQSSRKKFYDRLHDWLDKVVPNYLSELLILGGASYYFRKELCQSYSWTDIYWGEELIQEMIPFFESMNKVQIIRSLDVYGLHKYHYPVSN